MVYGHPSRFEHACFWLKLSTNDHEGDSPAASLEWLAH